MRPLARMRGAAKPNISIVRGQLEDGLAIATTAYTALVHAVDGSADEPPDLGQIATTLDHGLAILIRAISETRDLGD